MPAPRHNPFFKFFDKAILALVAIGLLWSAYRVATSSKVSKENDPRTLIHQYEGMIRDKLKEDAPPIELSRYNYVEQIQARYVRVPDPGSIRPAIFYKPRIKIYPTVYIGLNKTKWIKFEKPMDEGSVVCDKPWMLEVLHGNNPRTRDHPRTDALIRSLSEEGYCRVTGLEGSRQHVIPVLVSQDVDRVVLPPLDLIGVTQGGTVRIGWNANPENTRGGLQVVEYQVFKKRQVDAIAPFELIGIVKVEAAAAAPGAPATGGPIGGGRPPAPAPGAGEGAPQPTKEEKEAHRTFWFDDKQVVPDERYLYRVRTKADRSYPPESEFTKDLVVVTPPDVDFIVQGLIGNKVRIEVQKAHEGTVYAYTFEVGIGDPIGGVAKVGDAKEGINFATGCYLVDYFKGIAGPLYDRKTHEPTGRTGKTDRIVYEDKNGYGGMRWRNEAVSKELDTAVRGRKAPPGAGEAPPGAGGPEEIRPDTRR